MARVALPFGVSTPPDKRVSYRQALLDAGIEPVEASSLEGLQGLCLAGGADVEPAIYGEAPHPKTEQPDRERDALERLLLAEAIGRDLPVFAICRGLQLLNAHLGGALVQHVDGHDRRKVAEAHAVEIADGSLLASILGPGRYMVNTRHHQCAGRVAPGLLVSAVAEDGVLEALEMPSKRFVLAVQWHPEARAAGPDARLFAAFRDALR